MVPSTGIGSLENPNSGPYVPSTMLVGYSFSKGHVKQNIHRASIIDKHEIYIIICYIDSYNHKVVIGILHSLGISSSESDNFICFLNLLPFTGAAPCCPGNDGANVA